MARWIILISGLLTVDISYRISTFEVLLHHTSIISVSHVLYKDNQTFADAEIVVLEISSRQLGILEVLTVSKLDDCRVSYCPYHKRKKLKLMLFSMNSQNVYLTVMVLLAAVSPGGGFVK